MFNPSSQIHVSISYHGACLFAGTTCCCFYLGVACMMPVKKTISVEKCILTCV